MITKELSERRILVGITGASGACYAEMLINVLLQMGAPRLYLTATESGQRVVEHELSVGNPSPNLEGFSLRAFLQEKAANLRHREVIRVFRNDDLFAPIASGSSAPTDMVIVPCSMGTLGRVAHGISGNLLERAADVVLKQRRRLVMVPRETPLHSIHLQNMLTLSQAGAILVPPMPGYYQKPETIEDLNRFVVGKILEVLDLPHSLYQKWNARML